MKIAIVIHTSRYFGGGNKFAADLARGLNERGFNLCFCAWDKPVKGVSHEEFFEFKEWYTPSVKFNIGKLYRIAFNMRLALKKCVAKFRPDVLIGATTEPAIFSGFKHVRKLLYVHFPTEFKMYKHSLIHELYRSLYWWQHFKAIPQFDAIVCNSNYTKEITYIAWKGAQSDRDKYHTIYPCVDTSEFQIRFPRENKVCYIGRIDSNKGIEEVVDAFLEVKNSVPDCKLEIKGGVKGSPYAERFLPVLKNKLTGVEGVTLRTDVQRKEIVETLLTSRCMASLNFEEHFGIVPVEAMAAGTPPIVADGGGQKETVKNGETGFLVKDSKEMANRMYLLLSDDKLFNRLSANAAEHAKSFDRRVFTEKWAKLIEDL